MFLLMRKSSELAQIEAVHIVLAGQSYRLAKLCRQGESFCFARRGLCALCLAPPLGTLPPTAHNEARNGPQRRGKTRRIEGAITVLVSIGFHRGF